MLKIPIYATTQSRDKLGSTCAELLPYLSSQIASTASTPPNVIEHVDKTAFSMWIPEVARHFPASAGQHEIVIVGIEAHICVTQTTLDLLANGHKVYVLADGVSSCNAEEVKIALNRLRAEGAVVTTSESFLYELMGDAGIDE